MIDLKLAGARLREAPADHDLRSRHGIVPISTIPRERVEWAWKGRLAFGKHTDLSGDPGDGKSLAMMMLAAQVTTGKALPYGSARVREPRPVLYLSTEDDAADTIRPRLEAAGGDVDLLHVQASDKHLILPDCADDLHSIIRGLGAGMVVIDPLFSYIGDLDPNAYSSAVAVCDPLRRIASETRSIIVTIRHLNKAAGAAARYRAGGSVGWQAKPRVALSLGRDPSDKDVRLILPIKGNVGREPMAATFKIDEVNLGGEEVARVLWGAESALTADEVHGTEGAGPKAPSKTDAIVTYIRDRLASEGEDGIPWETLVGEVMKAKFTRTRSTIYDARARLAPEIVEFKANPDDPRALLRIRLKDSDPSRALLDEGG
jgi:hypothetical protein